ncbi:MAG: type III pantothenate kinase [Methylotenera sp.]|nr:type III pantothenate kinase [Methylotenera sp.]
MLLCIDSGNSKTKWALFNPAGEIDDFGNCLNSELTDTSLPQPSQYQRVIVANVAGENHQTDLIKNLANPAAPIHWLQSPAHMTGLHNHYQNPQSLGCDRFAAMMAAYCLGYGACVVVNAGTAVTIDALSIKNKRTDFLGGLILPGFHLMQQSLALGTAQLPATAFKSDLANKSLFANNTEDAMQAGALNAIVGAIHEMLTALSAFDDSRPSIIIGGGDAALIKSALTVTNPCTIVDNLVLHGLYFIDRNLQSESQ